tara:strand:- start:2012 stop:4192 length:2181 start_codon:yes stop_codon:yes gene_type:complete
MKIETFKNQVFNKPVGVVRSEIRTAESDTWESISRLSQALSGEFYKQAVDEAQKAGAKKALEVDVFDKNMQITKAPISMGTVGTSAFEETIMRRYEQKMHSLIDERISTVLRDNPNDSEEFNTQASIAVGGLLDKADPSMKGVLTDYATTKIAIGNNTVLSNAKAVEDQQTIFDLEQHTAKLGLQAINAFNNLDDRTGLILQEEIEKQYTDLVTEGILTGEQAYSAISAQQKLILDARIGISLRNMSLEEISVLASEYGKGRWNDLQDSSRMNRVNEIALQQGEPKLASYDYFKKLIKENPDVSNNRQIKRTINDIFQRQSALENAQKDASVNRVIYRHLENDMKIDIGNKEMGLYTQFVFDQAGVPLQTTELGPVAPNFEQLKALANNQRFYEIMVVQNKIPGVIQDKFQRLVTDGGLPNDEKFVVLEIYQNMRNNMSIRGMHRDLTSAMGMSENLSAQLNTLNNLVTFNSTPEGIDFAVKQMNRPADELLADMITSVNADFKPTNPVRDASGAENIIYDELYKRIKDTSIVNQVLHETMYLANRVGAKNAVGLMVDTVSQKWIQSEYAVDFASGGTSLQTRFAPEVVFGNTEAKTTFENSIKQLSGIKNAVLGENVFVIVDPNSANTNVRYYIATGEKGGELEPVIKNNQLVSIELQEFISDMDQEFQNMIKENLEYAGKIVKARKDTEEYLMYWGHGGLTAGSSYDEMFGVDLSGAKNAGYNF